MLYTDISGSLYAAHNEIHTNMYLRITHRDMYFPIDNASFLAYTELE